MKCPFSFDIIVVHRTALLYPAYNYNNQTHGGLGRACATEMYRSTAHVEFPKLQTRIFVEWKVTPDLKISPFKQKAQVTL